MKKRLFPRALSLLLVLCLLLGVLVLPAQAAESADSYNGSQLWLNYRQVADSARLNEYKAAATAIIVQNYDANPTYRHSRSGSVWTPQRPSNAQEAIPASTLEAARMELSRAISGLTGSEVLYADSVSADGAIIVGTPESSPLIASLDLGAALAAVGDEGYVIRSVTIGGKAATAIAGNTEIGALYGTYAFIRLMQTQKTIKGLNISDKPKVNHRRLNNWDAERLYAGTNATGEGSSTGGDGSIFEFSSGNNRLPIILDRYIIFARMCASVGINEITINNVNAKEAYLSEEYILMEAALADVLRPYGVHIGLSVRYTSATNSACNTSADRSAGGPSQISGNDANNPYVEKFQNWWTQKTEQIRSRIPDFIGYTVKANSEGQPGPQDYGYDHSDGAHGLGQALAKVNDGLPNKMTLFWRTFVYNASVDTDRLKRAYMEFKPINDDPSRSFGDNVFVQTKNGPLDFQGREPFHPMFGAMDQTNQAIEVQLTQEYTGHHISLCYLGTEWEEIYKSDTMTGGKQVLVGEVLDGSAQGQVDTAIVGVNNVGNSPNMTGNHFSAANFFAFGRQAWDWTQSAEDIAEDWVRMTWSNDEQVVETIVAMMMGSYEALVSYQTPYGVGHQMTGTGTHYFPNPAQIIFNGGSIRDDWSPAYYSRVDGVGVGYNRTSHTELTSFGMQMGSDLAHQYAPALAEQYDNIETTPENLILWFHHVPWDYEMKDGDTFWENAVYLMQEGVQYVSWMRDAWASLEGKIDTARFNAVTEKLWRQEIDASEWRDFYRGYWNTNNGLDIPVDDGALSIAVTLGSGANRKTFKGFDLSVDEFNKSQPGNLPNSDSRRSRYNAAGGNIADASGSPFSNMFVPVDKTYTLTVPSGVSRTVSKVEFLSDEGGEGNYEVVSSTDSQLVIKVQREGAFGMLSKTYTFNLVADVALSGIQVNGVSIPGFDPDDTEYAVMIDDVAPVVPAITATAEDPTAEVTVTPAQQVPGKTTITVKNGSATRTYTVSLTGKAGFVEEFDGSAPSADWTWVRETASGWAMANSALTISAASGDIKGGTNTARNILTRGTGGGDWEATAKLSLSAIPSGSNQAAFLIYQDDGNYLKVNVEYASNYLRASGGVERNGSYSDLFYDALETRQNLSASKNVVYFRVVKEADTYRLSWGTGDTALRSLGKTTINLTDPKLGTLATGAGSFRVSYDRITLEDNYDLAVESTCTHDYQSAVTAPTCTEFGYTTYTCTKCGASYTDDRVDPLGHDWDGGKVTTPPTATSSGVRTYTCKRCGETRTERIPRTGAGPVDVDFTDLNDADKYEIVGQASAAPAQGTGLALVTTRNAVEPCNGQNDGDQANTPEDLVKIDVSGDWTATLTVDFNTNGASNGYYQFFGFYAAEGEDYQNMAGIRGGNNDMQDFLRVGGSVTADTEGVRSSPGFSSNGTYVLRLEKQGTTYICCRTSDGENFTEMFRYEDTGIEADYIVIDAYTGMTTGYQFTLKSLEFEGGAPMNWALADSVEAGKQYVIVSNGYALTNTVAQVSTAYGGTSLASTPVTVADGIITSEVTDEMIWDFAAGTSASNNGFETGYFLTSGDSKFLSRNGPTNGNPAPLDTQTYDAENVATKPQYCYWVVQDLDEEGNKAVFCTGTGEWTFALRGSAEGFDAPGNADANTVASANPVRLYELTGSAPVQPTVSKAALNAAIAKAQAVSRSAYTDESLAAMDAALETAIAARSATEQSVIDAAAAALEAAVTALERKPDVPVGDLTNYALRANGGSAAGSANYEGDINNVIDGAPNKNSRIRWASDDLPATLTIELSEVRSIRVVDVISQVPDSVSSGETEQGMTTNLGLKGIDVSASVDGINWTVIGAGDPNNTLAWQRFALDAPVNAKYVKIDMERADTFDGWARVLEVQVWGAPIEACDHNYVAVVTAPTCTEKGYTTYTCSKCGDSYTGAETAALGHSFGEWAVTTAPTCEGRGVETRACTRCGAKETREVDALGHDYKNGKCTRCGAADPNYVPPIDKAALQAAIAAAEAIDRSLYTDASVAALEAALTAAQAALNAGTQAAVDKAAADLTNAVNALEEKEVYTFVACGGSTGGTATINGEAYVEGFRVNMTAIPGEAVVLKAQPLAGYAFDGWYEGVVGESGFVEDRTDKRISAKAEYSFVPEKGSGTLLYALFVPAAEPFRFDDVKDANQYYYAPVYWAVEQGITNGTSKTEFSPEKGCTRAQVVTFLWRAAGEPKPTATTCNFEDVKKGAYYYDAVLWAVENNITNGTSKTTFDPEKTCTRAQIVTFLWRAAKEPKPTATTCDFTDVKAGAYYYNAVLWAVEKEITNGTSKNTFDPEKTCTRAQIVTFLYRAK